MYVVSLYGYQQRLRKQRKQFGQLIIGKLFSNKNEFILICLFFIFIYKIAYKSLVFKQALSDINFGNPPLCCLPISTINISFLTFQHRSPSFCFHMICFHSNVICCPSSFPPRGQHFLYIENRFLPSVVHPDYSFLSLFCSQFLSTAPLILKVRNIIKNAKPITRLDTEVAWCSVMSAQCLMLQSL